MSSHNGSEAAGALTRVFSENEDLPNTTNPDDWARIGPADLHVNKAQGPMVNRAIAEHEGYGSRAGR